MTSSRVRRDSLLYLLLTTIAFLEVSDWAVAQRTAPEKPPIIWETQSERFVTRAALTSYRQVKPRRLGKEQAREMIANLQQAVRSEFSLDRIHKRGNRLIMTSKEDPSAVFDLDLTTGAFLFNAGLKKYDVDESTNGLTSKEAAPDLARKYLEKLNYLPKDKRELVVESVGGLGMSLAKDGKTEDFQKLITVYFRRTLDGVPVQGRGSRIAVHLGEQDSLVGIIRNWPEVKPQEIRQARVKKEDVIRKEITARLLDIAGQAEQINVQKASLVLFDDGRGVIEPAVYVEASARYEGPKGGKDLVEIPVDFYVPILLEPAAYYPFQQDAEATPPAATEDRQGESKGFTKDENE